MREKRRIVKDKVRKRKEKRGIDPYGQKEHRESQYCISIALKEVKTAFSRGGGGSSDNIEMNRPITV